MAQRVETTHFQIRNRIADAARGDVAAYYDLGIAFSSGSDGVNVDLVEAHKWFNLGAVGGDAASQQCRAEIAGEMTSRQIADAQRQARDWMRVSTRITA